ncbi:RNA polymerase sigma-70 factor [Mucilaginibacter paludis]|uniref:RNA polymerase, sigma-24 subunit, ECF subfamily n=1 Tax=Mucilaginibacter paludis DSM 18603 TaxID=714943 RepID=H1YBN9_9SPHI|nr:RNA polymerase sigma-70 factor [Mucilaginibacter paludis]EHQ26002.1 RNA polymerase, sigma-24 subunit, ECF subfamily [Mucilaginibacter paludis DSM 18603]
MAFKDLPDHILIEKCREDNLQAYDALFFRYFKKIYSFALSSLHDEDIAKELSMDVMLRLWQKKGDILIEADLSAYLFQSIRNALYNHWRRKAVLTRPIEYLEDNLAHVSRPADYNLNHKELQHLYQEKLNLLSPQRKQVFRLSREENMSYSEIASHLNLSIHTVRNHINASLQHFRDHLQELATILLPILALIAVLAKA